MNIYETHVMKDSRLPFIFHVATQLGGPRQRQIQTNWHENLELIYVLEGRGTVLCDTERFSVEAGDLVAVNANCMHSYYAEAGLFSYHCLIVDRSFCLANHFDTNDLTFESLFCDERIAELMLALAREYTPPYSPDFRVPAIRALVLSVMAALCRAHVLANGSGAVRKDPHILSCIKQAIGLIRSQSERELSLEETAAFVGLSKYYFAREFRRVTGHTFVSYVNFVRCEKAKSLLLENEQSIGAVGRSCGFDNQSYFNRVFREHTGLCPGEYREKNSKYLK